MASITDSYFAALNGLDREAYLACFAENALLQDPYGGRPLQGTTGLHKFMDGMERTWASFQMTPGDAHAAGDRVAIPWRCTAVAKSGKTAHFAGVNVFTIDESGLISQLDGYWDFKAMVSQIS